MNATVEFPPVAESAVGGGGVDGSGFGNAPVSVMAETRTAPVGLKAIANSFPPTASMMYPLVEVR